VIWNDVDVTGLPSGATPTALAADPVQQGRVFVGFGFGAGGVYTDEIAVYTVDVDDALASMPPAAAARLLATPNPFRKEVSVALPADTPADASAHPALAIFDAAGRCVRTLGTEGGARSIIWDGRDVNGDAVPPGVYFATLVLGDDAARSVRIVRLD
jgi:hypothetical protein